MIEPWASAALARVEETAQLAAEIRAMVERTRRIIETSPKILSAHDVRPLPARAARVSPPQTAAPDALCASFDALLEAARQAEHADDPELFALVERALLHAGDRIEQTASILAHRVPPVQ